MPGTGHPVVCNTDVTPAATGFPGENIAEILLLYNKGFKRNLRFLSLSWQVYIRIKDDEWNIYRRYTEFRSLHHKLQNKYPQVRAYNFPPKKAIGNKVPSHAGKLTCHCLR